MNHELTVLDIDPDGDGQNTFEFTTGIVSDNVQERTVIDPEASEGAKFCRVGTTKP